jgi:hypothetical protein
MGVDAAGELVNVAWSGAADGVKVSVTGVLHPVRIINNASRMAARDFCIENLYD